ncbi:unnamed protein product [Leptosia nina]|uniref:C2H2-type domain-containing protein n=1 Tax=Leptosia nina TaxID=320188 RepID=A0AAV1JZF3_9NEOP
MGDTVFIDVSAELYDNLDPTENIDKETVKDEIEYDSSQEGESLLPKTCKFVCSECERYSAETEEQLTRHILKVHRGENPFQCFMCDYTTSNKGNFEEHVRRHEGKKPFKCAYCPHRNVSKKNLKKHELIHRPDNPLKCPHCDHIAKHKRGFTFHAKKFHSTQDGILTCVKCDTKFEDQASLTDHVNCQVTCDKCDFSACNTLILDEHSRSHDRKKVKRKKNEWTCAICGWQSSKHPKILLHLIHHPNQEVQGIDISILQRHGIMT